MATFRDALTVANPDSKGDTGKALFEQNGAGSPPVVEKPVTPKRQDGNSEGSMEFTWPLSGDAVATLTVSKAIQADDIDILKAYFELAEKVLLKATKKSTLTMESVVAQIFATQSNGEKNNP